MALSMQSGRPAACNWHKTCRGTRPRCVAVRAVAAPAQTGYKVDVDSIQFINPVWSQPKKEAEFLGIIAKLVEAGKCPPQLQAGWIDFYNNYKKAVLSSGIPDAELVATKIQCTIADCVFNQFVNPYTFPSLHKRLLEPYNYYQFGQNYVGTLIDFSSSFLGHQKRWDQIAQQLKDGHNVVLLANHQTEADPGVFAHMLTATHPQLATDVIYVAGE
eukprot:gene3541-3810_t